MAGPAIEQQVTDLMARAGKEHHLAFLATDGEDPEWPIWYAGFLQQPLGELLKTDFTKSRLVYCVMDAEFEREAREPDAAWAGYYAKHFTERFAPTDSAVEDTLMLYHFEGCPFCALVREAVQSLGVNVELRNIHEESSHREALIEARGRATVPVLRVISPDGSERWMPESRDIVDYLERTYG